MHPIIFGPSYEFEHTIKSIYLQLTQVGIVINHDKI